MVPAQGVTALLHLGILCQYAKPPAYILGECRLISNLVPRDLSHPGTITRVEGTDNIHVYAQTHTHTCTHTYTHTNTNSYSSLRKHSLPLPLAYPTYHSLGLGGRVILVRVTLTIMHLSSSALSYILLLPLLHGIPPFLGTSLQLITEGSSPLHSHC